MAIKKCIVNKEWPTWKVAWSKLSYFPKFQENHFPKVIGLSVTKNVWNSAVLYANKSSHGKKKPGAASSRNTMEEVRGCVWPIIYKRKIPLFAVRLEQTYGQTWQTSLRPNQIPCICRSLTDTHLGDLRSHYWQERRSCVCYEQKLCITDYMMNIPA